jgi:hypothetical protein
MTPIDRARWKFLIAAALLGGTAQAQDLVIDPWVFHQPAPTTGGLVVQCERAGQVTDPAGNALRLRAVSEAALQPPNASYCSIAIEARSRITVAAPVLLRVRTLLRGNLVTSQFTSASVSGAVFVGARCFTSSNDRRSGLDSSGLAVAESIDVCLPAGSSEVLVRLQVDTRVDWGPAVDTWAFGDFWTGERGYSVDFTGAGPCSIAPPAMLDPHVGVFADRAGTRCNISASPFQLGTMYVLARGGSSCALSGAEFRIDGFPSDWQAWVYPSPSTLISIGNPIAGGCNIAFANCLSTSPAPALVYRIDFLPTSVVTNRVLRVDRHSSPACDLFCCPLWVLCDAPIFTKVCIPLFESRLNGNTDPCTTGVEDASWSAVKAIYRR